MAGIALNDDWLYSRKLSRRAQRDQRRACHLSGMSGMSGMSSSGVHRSSLLTSLAPYYNFETLTADASPAGLTLVNNGTITQSSSGIIGKAASLVAASSQFFSLADAPQIHFTFWLSLNLWVKPTTVSINQCLISKGILATDLEWALQIVAANNFRFNIGEVNGNVNGVAAGLTVSAGTWYNVIVVFDGTQTGNANRLKMWVNGAQQTLTFTGSIPNTNVVGSNPMNIGKLGGAAPQFTNALLDEIGLSPIAWAPSQAASFYGGGTPPAFPFAGIQ